MNEPLSVIETAYIVRGYAIVSRDFIFQVGGLTDDQVTKLFCLFPAPSSVSKREGYKGTHLSLFLCTDGQILTTGNEIIPVSHFYLTTCSYEIPEDRFCQNINERIDAYEKRNKKQSLPKIMLDECRAFALELTDNRPAGESDTDFQCRIIQGFHAILTVIKSFNPVLDPLIDRERKRNLKTANGNTRKAHPKDC
jgi:hypothetical protein